MNPGRAFWALEKLLRQRIETWESALHLGRINLNLEGRIWKGRQIGTGLQQPCVHMSFQMPAILSGARDLGRGFTDQGEYTKQPN